jgi:ABC-2 type transport system permease protein
MNAIHALTWFARHEGRLAWRDALSMMTAGRPDRERRAWIWLGAFAIALHVIAYLLVRNFVAQEMHADLTTLIAVTASILLSGSAMLSQAMESVTRTFYSRSDLELILSAPVKAERLFAVRIGAMTLSAALMSILLMGPFINILIWRDGWRWLGAYGVLVAVSLITTSLAVVITIKLFQWIGPRRTRLAAQITAAIVGGVFVIGLQTAAMFSSGTLSRLSALKSDVILAHAPGLNSPVWWAAKAALGDGLDLVWVLTASVLIFLAVTARYAPRFAGYVIAATSVAQITRQSQASTGRFRVVSPASTLRHKEQLLILRDPWLISQSLMQLLYLSPPALLLWHNYGSAGGAIVLVPVLVMTSGQLAGGLAWLTISGEDAPDLVQSAPVSPTRLLRAKAEAVMQCIAIVFSPFIVALLLISRQQALFAAGGIAAAALSSIAIQLWFRSQAKRSQFRRRHTSSRIATLAEAIISIAWAGTGTVAVSGNTLWPASALFAMFLLLCVRWLSPSRLQ